MCVDHIGSPLSNAKRKIEHIYSGPMESDLVDMMVQCDPDVSTTDMCSGIFQDLIWDPITSPSQFKKEQKLTKMVYIILNFLVLQFGKKV